VILACVDIGNTRSHVGLYRRARLLRRWSVATGSVRSLNRALRAADAVAAASVCPSASRKLRHSALRWMGRDFPAAIRVDVDRPSEVGMDRLANAAAAFARMGGACLVVDLGTAITFDVVAAGGAFVGGAIAPGMDLASRALFEYAALLPKVRPRRPERFIGRRTESNIRSGLYWATVGLIEAGIREVRRELRRRVPVVGTGGDSAAFRRFFDAWVPTLTLEGIRISHDIHRGSDDGAGTGRHRGH